MKKNNTFANLHIYGSLLFVTALILAIGTSVFSLSPTVSKILTIVLIILGVSIGALNITRNETVPFLVSCITLTLLLGPLLGAITQVFELETILLSKMYMNVISVVIPAAIFVALKAIFYLAKEE